MATSIRIDEALNTKISALAEAKHRTKHWIIIEAIKEYIAKEESRTRFVQEAIKAWEDYQKTGLHLTGHELISWLRKQGTEDETEMPECHV
ncbi:MAG: CopG family ribbon-helix-helix protein [Neisseriaceae bacterium]|jgi:predicted transcriptional regulator